MERVVPPSQVLVIHVPGAMMLSVAPRCVKLTMRSTSVV
jgi:hypothetical protein